MGAPLGIERIKGDAADYLRFRGVIDEQFSSELLGAVTRPTVFDLNGVQLITFRGVRNWCDVIRQIPSTVPLYLVNAPACIIDQLLQVPNFGGHAQVLSAAIKLRCESCDRELFFAVDLGSPIETPSCPYCQHALGALVEDMTSTAARYGARTPHPEVLALLEKLSAYRRRGDTGVPFDVAKLVDGDATVMRLRGRFDARRARRLVTGLEGALVIDASQLRVEEEEALGWTMFVESVAQECRPTVLVDLPYHVLERVAAQSGTMARVIIHSVLAPCYCSSCDQIDQLSIVAERLKRSRGGQCRRCGRSAPVVAGMMELNRWREQLVEAPLELHSVIGRMNELFSSAAVAAKLASGTHAQKRDVARPTMIGPYRIVRRIGSGGMAEVLLGSRDDGFGKPVAIKLYRADLLAKVHVTLEMFLREARLSARLNHPNIVQVFDVGEADGNLYMVMEFLEGVNLRKLRAKISHAIPPDVVTGIALQLLSALSYAHEARDHSGKLLGIVHRDISPANVIVSNDGHVKLIDFGVAVQVNTAEVAAGNPPYMSPEQLNHETLDGRSDLFSLATVLYELFTGENPFAAVDLVAVFHKITTAPIPPPPGVSPKLALVLAKAHARIPTLRFKNADEFAEALRSVAKAEKWDTTPRRISEWLAAGMTAHVAPAAPERPSRIVKTIAATRGLSRRLWIGAAITIVLIAAVAVWLGRG